MPLVNLKEILGAAAGEDWAAGSFSVSNMEMVLGVLQAAEEMGSPVILQIAEVRLKHSPLELIGPLMVAAAENAGVPVAVHFDHGTTLAAVQTALDIGFTSVMIDGSRLPFEENAALTRKVKKMADDYGADTEAEIGSVGGSEDGSEHIAVNCTDPAQAVDFLKKTGVDALAVAIGNAHGNYKQAPQLRFDILESIGRQVSTPLVLHGGTGLTPGDFRRCIQNGVKKINIATATFDAVEEAVRRAFEAKAVAGYYDIQTAEVNGAYENALKHIEIFGCAGKADII
ncbi:MAG TPA: class II aldolase [Clostridiales bacterium]|mgnify:CR=1 FL=1|nr:class II aldolase [Clostridiales bacterium]